ncbi:MAG: DNA primase [Bacilli bacterium]|nr:DNA primase [Bacilli bacterium]MDD4733703.1 DNA primase [Bacilli bacterium]
MVKIEQSLINEVCKNLDIVDVISNYLDLAPRGNNYFGLCPFHEEKTPSFVVSKEKQIFHCFGCEPPITGNVISFIMKKEEIGFLEALRKCSEMSGIDIGLSNYKAVKKENIFFKIYDDALKLYQNSIFTVEGRPSRDYLLNRGIDEDTIKKFGIGLAINRKDVLTKYLVNKSYKYKDLLKSGLVSENNGFYDMYRNRIMIPIEDDNGQVVGFSGRSLDKNDPNKYINSQTSDIFKKSELLYNLNRAKEFIKKQGKIIITEGFFDVISCSLAEVNNVVATMGTALTKEHIRKLKKLSKEVILCFDGDKAGINATLTCSNELIKNDIMPKIISLEEGLDPDDYIRKYGKEKFKSKSENPISYIDYKFNYLKEIYNLNDSVELAKYVNLIIEDLKQVEDDVQREISINKLSKESNLEVEFIKSKLKSTEKKVIKDILPKQKVINSKYDEAQKKLIYYMLIDKNVILMYKKKVTHMPIDRYRNLANDIRFFYDDYNYINVSDFMNKILSDDEKIKTLSEILSMELKEKYSEEEIEDYINAINEYNTLNNVDALKNKVFTTNGQKSKAEIAEEILKIRKGEY